MKYKGNDYQMCDAWYLNVNDRIHTFNLKIPGSTENMSVAHSYTDDLLHFERCDDILSPLKSESLPEDYLDKWTGCGYTAPDGTHYIYYTMRNKWESQKIGVAISKDLKNFELYDKNPVLVPDKNVFAYTGKDGIKEDCRDMIVVWDENSSKFYGYFATMAETDSRLTGVIGVAESTDLINWCNQSIAYVPRFDGVIEVPDVFFLDGKWYLTVLTHTCFGAKGTFLDANVKSGTIYASSDSPSGPFTEKEDNVFIGGTLQSGYTCRTFMFKGKRYVMYIDKSEYGWAVSLPKEVKVINGNLKPCYTKLIKDLRNGVVIENITQDKLVKKSCSIAWNVGNATAVNVDDGVLVKTNDYSYQSFMIESDTVSSAEAEFNICLNCTEAGLIVKTDNDEFSIAANTKEKSLTVYSGGLNFDIFCKRDFDFEKGKEYKVRVILLEGQLEIYIDDVLVIQNAFKTQNMNFGLIVGCGCCSFNNFKIYNLEN